MISYIKLSDNELQNLAVSGDRAAEEQLAMRYSRAVRICARPFFLAGGDSEDLLQEGMIGLLSAMREYDPAGGASFHTYAELCIRRRIISAARSASRLKHAPLNDGIPLEDFISSEEQYAALYGGRSAEDQVLDREGTSDFLTAYSSYLSEFESRILKDYLDGLSYSEIAENCGRSEKSIDNAVQRIRKKLARRILPPGDLS